MQSSWSFLLQRSSALAALAFAKFWLRRRLAVAGCVPALSRMISTGGSSSKRSGVLLVEFFCNFLVLPLQWEVLAFLIFLIWCATVQAHTMKVRSFESFVILLQFL